MLVYGIVSLILAYAGLGGVRIISWFASTIIAASWFVPGVGSVVSKKLSATGARWAMIAGFLGFFIPKCLNGFVGAPFNAFFINFFDPFFVGIYASLIFAVIGSKLHPVTEEETSFRSKMMVIPETEKVAADYKRDRLFGWIMIVFGILTTVVLLLGWALPYNGMI